MEIEEEHLARLVAHIESAVALMEKHGSCVVYSGENRIDISKRGTVYVLNLFAV